MTRLGHGRWGSAFLLIFTWPTHAYAHAAHEPAETLWSTFTFDAFVLAPLGISCALFTIGLIRVWTRAGLGHGIRGYRAALYGLGLLALAGALVSPLHWLGERLFTAHMIEHEIVMAVAAPLLVASRPLGAFVWALPLSWRGSIGALAGASPVAAGWRFLTTPVTATTLHAAAIWGWHAPAAFNLAVENENVHRLQHLSFFVTALLFWWAVLKRPRHEHGLASMHLFVTMIHMSILGALLTLSPRVWYGAGMLHAAEWGLTPLEDQQLAGLVMWAPAGMIYVGAALMLLASWIAPRSLFPAERARPAILPASVIPRST